MRSGMTKRRKKAKLTCEISRRRIEYILLMQIELHVTRHPSATAIAKGNVDHEERAVIEKESARETRAKIYCR